MTKHAETREGRERGSRRPDTVFWVEPDAAQLDRVVLDAEESRHLLHVHRAAPGTTFLAVDGAGGTYQCVLESAAGKVAVGKVVGRQREQGELPISIELVVGLGDPGSADAVVEAAVPLGVTSIDIVACSRSGRPALGAQRLERLHRVARAALKQSRRSRLPAIRSSDGLEAATGWTAAGLRLVADPDGTPLQAAAKESLEGAVMIAVGPPGGFEPTERQILRARDFLPISLGPSRLRTELAATTLLALARNLIISQ